VKVEIQIGSLETSINEGTTTLKTSEWFGVKNFPTAIFKSTRFTSKSQNQFILEGELTIKGKTIPIKFDFALEKFDEKFARAVGSSKLNRNDFAIGAPDPKNAHGVEPEVEFSFIIEASK